MKKDPVELPENSYSPLNEHKANSTDIDLPPDGEEYRIEENEPYLGPSWAILMLVLYCLKEFFHAKTYSGLWFFQIYILLIVVGITVFTLVKRHIYFKTNNQASESNSNND